MKNALELRNVTKRYKDFTLNNISLTLPEGCIMGVIGENGAGKSTMIKLILDLVGRDEGTIMIMGKDNLTELTDIKEHIGVVMDESCFADNLNIKNINGIMKNIYRTWDQGKFATYVENFGLPAKKPVKEYSRGMKMNLSIAVALSHDSRLLILDEATSGLDPVVRDEILDVFMEFIQNGENSVLLSSHITSDLEKACDYISFLHKGELLKSQSKDELLETYGVLKCSLEELEQIDGNDIIGYRKNKFGAEALVKKENIRGDYIIDNASLEDIMLFYIKREAVR